MAQSPVEKIPIFQCKYSLTGIFRTNNDYQITLPLVLNMENVFPGLKWNEDYEQYSFSFNTNNCDHIRMFLELLIVSFVFEPAQYKLIPEFYNFVKSLYDAFLEKEMTPTIKKYTIVNKWSIYSEYDGTILELVRKEDDGWGHE